MMTERLPATPAPGPLEEYAQAFDVLFAKRSQRESFRRCLEGLLLPMERNKTLTGLANTEPVIGAQHRQAQRLQWFLSESNWDPVMVAKQRVTLLLETPHTAPNAQGALVIDETGDRKWGNKTAHVGRQYLNNIGKIDNGVVSVQTVWADEQQYYPLNVEPYTPAHWFTQGKQDVHFRTKPQIALELIKEAMTSGIPFRAVVGDSFYGENDQLRTSLMTLEVGYVMSLKPSHSWWHAEGTPGSLWELVQRAPWQPDTPGKWHAVTRRFRNGLEETWWALEVTEGPYGPDKAERVIVVTTDPVTLPDDTTWYLVTDLPAPGTRRARRSNLSAATLNDVVRLYGLRIWIEQSYKQVKQHLGWAQYQVRSDMAIRRHWELVCCAFCFCWWALDWAEQDLVTDATYQPVPATTIPHPLEQQKKRTRNVADHPQLASSTPSSARLAGALSDAAALLVRLVRQTPSTPTPGAS